MIYFGMKTYIVSLASDFVIIFKYFLRIVLLPTIVLYPINRRTWLDI